MQNFIRNKIKRALITGITGQDGIYLSKLLLKKGYEVHGLVRPSRSQNHLIINQLKKSSSNNFFLHKGDLRKGRNIELIIKKLRPDEVYNLGAISDIATAEKRPSETFNINFLGVLRILESVKSFSPQTKFFQAGSLAQFSYKKNGCFSETDKPVSVYGRSKQLAFHLIKEYRNKYNLFACCGFMSNHESYLRSQSAISKKIIKNIIAYQHKEVKQLNLKNLNINSKKSWGHAEDFVRAMWLMLQNDIAEDFIITSNNQRTLSDFCTVAFNYFNINIVWFRVNGYDIAKDSASGKILIKNRYLSNNNGAYYSAPFDNIENKLNWVPKITFEEIIHNMIRQELKNNKIL